MAKRIRGRDEPETAEAEKKAGASAASIERLGIPIPQGIDVTMADLELDRVGYRSLIMKYMALGASGATEHPLQFLLKPSGAIVRNMAAYFAWGKLTEGSVQVFTDDPLFEELGHATMAYVILTEDSLEKLNKEIDLEILYKLVLGKRIPLDESATTEQKIKELLEERITQRIQQCLEKEDPVLESLVKEFKKIGIAIAYTNDIAEQIRGGQANDLDVEQYLKISDNNMAMRFLILLNLIFSNHRIPEEKLPALERVMGNIERAARTANDVATLVREVLEADCSNSIIVDALSSGEVSLAEIQSASEEIQTNQQQAHEKGLEFFNEVFFNTESKPRVEITTSIEILLQKMRPAMNRAIERWQEAFEELRGEEAFFSNLGINTSRVLENQVKFLWHHIFLNKYLLKHDG